MKEKQFLRPREDVKVGSSDMFCKLFEKIRNFMVPNCTIKLQNQAQDFYRLELLCAHAWLVFSLVSF